MRRYSAKGMSTNSDWTVAEGFEAVRDLFLAGAGSFGIGGGAYCAYIGGSPVVDLWAGEAQPGEPWQRETTAVLMSATKGFGSMCLQVLVDCGSLDIDAKVADYWPEYAQNGKEETTVLQLVLHTAGVVGFDQMHDVVHHDGTGWGDLDSIAPRLAASAPSFAPGTQYSYHALSIGWLVGELVRRIDGRTLGKFFADEIAHPLGLDIWIGLPAEHISRVAHVYPVRLDFLPKPLRTLQEAVLAGARDPQKLLGRAFVGNGSASPLDFVERLFNHPAFLTDEVPAGNGVATARSLAKCWAMMANGGELHGRRVLSADVVDSWRHVISSRPDAAFAQLEGGRLLGQLATAPAPRTVGHLGNAPLLAVGNRFGPNPNAYGAEGLGGQFGFCDPDAHIAVGYVRSELAAFDIFQATLTRELYRCAAAAGHSVTVTEPPPTPMKRLLGSAVEAYARRRLTVPARLGRRAVSGTVDTHRDGSR